MRGAESQEICNYIIKKLDRIMVNYLYNNKIEFFSIVYKFRIVFILHFTNLQQASMLFYT